MKNIVLHFAAAIIISIIMLTIYVTVQQSYRTAANDPQLQIANDIKSRIERGQNINNLLPKDTIDLEHDAGVFVELVDKNLNVLQTTGLLKDAPPKLPENIYEYTKQNGEDILSWQPLSNLRMAIVIVRIQSSDIAYAVIGRSLKETETLESNLIKTIFMTWVMCIAVVLINCFITSFTKKKSVAS